MKGQNNFNVPWDTFPKQSNFIALPLNTEAVINARYANEPSNMAAELSKLMTIPQQIDPGYTLGVLPLDTQAVLNGGYANESGNMAAELSKLMTIPQQIDPGYTLGVLPLNTEAVLNGGYANKPSNMAAELSKLMTIPEQKTVKESPIPVNAKKVESDTNDSNLWIKIGAAVASILLFIAVFNK